MEMQKKTVRYDMRTANETGYKQHPQITMKEMGLTVIQSESVPIADCWFFEVDKLPDTLPKFLTLSNWEFTIK